ncbi:MAG: zinc ribbon domain-containing protein [Candidatus Eremiobacteraeota bacterium]|nr:zinc ribbon domain-containing protein [Candidatus Eremiobacteraeota bacterium]MCW5868726.1 zinc ribbon domain-containing protein [Candidatus Eremiobacteraeota bacterium]
MSSEHIRNLLGSFAEEEEPAPLQLFLDWWAENPEAAPEDWERVAGAVDEEVESSYQALREITSEAAPFAAGLGVLAEMRRQRGWPQAERRRAEWLSFYQQLEQLASLWASWSEQSLCPACGQVNPAGWSACQECGQALAVDEPAGDWKEVAPAGQLPPDLQRLLRAIADWRQDGRAEAVLEQLGGMRARYQAAARQLQAMSQAPGPELVEQFEQAQQVVGEMAALPLHWDQLDRGYRLLCGHLAEANRLMAS